MSEAGHPTREVSGPSREAAYAPGASPPRPASGPVLDPGAALLAMVAIGLERLVHYGVRSMMVLYFMEERGLELEQTSRWLALFGTSLVVGPLLGGLAALALGPTVPAVVGALVVAVATASLGLVPTEARPACLAGVALGQGLLKPNLYALVGTRFASSTAGRIGAFLLAYVVLNLGAAAGPMGFSTVVMSSAPWSVAFLGAGGLMVAVAALAGASGALGRLDMSPVWDPAVGRQVLGALLVIPAGALCWLPIQLATQPLYDGNTATWLSLGNSAAVVVGGLGLVVGLGIAVRLEAPVREVPLIGACLLLAIPGAVAGSMAGSLGLPAALIAVVVLSFPEVAIGALGMSRVTGRLSSRVAPLMLAGWMASTYLGSMLATPLLAWVPASTAVGLSAAVAGVYGLALIALGPWMERTLFDPPELG